MRPRINKAYAVSRAMVTQSLHRVSVKVQDVAQTEDGFFEATLGFSFLSAPPISMLSEIAVKTR